MVDNLLPDYEGLPHVLDLAVHLVHLSPCDYSVTPVPIGLRFGFWTALSLGLGLRGPDLGIGLDNFKNSIYGIHAVSVPIPWIWILVWGLGSRGTGIESWAC